MFVIVAIYRARDNDEDAIIALHEDKIQRRDFDPRCYHSWQLFRKSDEPQAFISIAQFADEQLMVDATKDLEKDGWYNRLVSLMEGTPINGSYKVVWSLN
jgi:hypothetical protein